MNIDLDALIEELKNLELGDDIARVAFFDADHTMWSGDLGDLAFNRALGQRRFLPEAAEPMAKLLEDSGGEAKRDPHADAEALYARYKEGGVDEVAIIDSQVLCYTGWQRDALVELGHEVMRDGLGDKIYAGMRELHAALRTLGIEIRVISGTSQELVEAGVSVFGIAPEMVRGARAKIVDGKIHGEMDGASTYREGKVVAMKAMIGEATAVAGFGDSTSDTPMLERCILRVGVNPRPSLRQHGESNDPDRWRFVIPPQTVDGTPVSPLTIDRVII